MQFNAKIFDLRDALRKSFRERTPLIDGMLAAVLARKTLFVLGPPGTAKSKISDALCNAIEGKFFKWQFSKFTTPEEILGPYSLKGLQEDRYVRITKDKLPEATIGFIDEIFKGSSAIMNILLPIINEREFYSDGCQKIPLQTLVSASNEIPQGDELAALYDRFILRYTVDRMKSEDNFKDLLVNGLLLNLPHITVEELKAVQDDVDSITFGTMAVEKFMEVRRAIAGEEIYISDRRWMEAVGAVKAFAYLNKHATIEVEDLTMLENILWSSPEQITQVRTLVRKLCNPIADVLDKHIDAANATYSNWKSNPSKFNVMDGFSKIKASKAELTKLAQHHPNRTDIKDALSGVTVKLKEMAKAEMGDDV